MTVARRPTVAFLVPHWGRTDEEGWITRQVAGALALVADVHIITPEGSTAGSTVDGAFTLHALATPLGLVDELRRDLLIQAFEATSTSAEVVSGPGVAELLDAGLVTPWSHATAVLDQLRPDLAVVVGHRTIGALRALADASTRPRYVLLATVPEDQTTAGTHFRPLFDGAETILTVTDAERSAIVEHHGRADAVHRIGTPLALNPSALTEPNPWVGDSDYILVRTTALRAAEKKNELVEEHELARLIRMCFPDRPVGVAHPDAFCVWHNGQVSEGWPIERSSDLARLFAFARLFVDLEPGKLFARGQLESLLYGTPIIVPAGRRAVEHAQVSGAGLWFENPGDLVGTVGAALDPAIHDTFVKRGRAYVEDRYGPTDRFVHRVVSASGLPAVETGGVPISA